MVNVCFTPLFYHKQRHRPTLFGIVGAFVFRRYFATRPYLAVWNTIPPQKPDPLLTYVCRIVRNLALKKYHENTAKKRNSIYDVALDEIIDCIPASFSVEDELAAKEVAGMINSFLGTLDRQSRVMFVRRYWHADSIEDIAVMFHKSRHYISVRLSRIRKALKQYLETEGISV